MHAFINDKVWPVVEMLKRHLTDVDISMGLIRAATDVTVPVQPKRPMTAAAIFPVPKPRPSASLSQPMGRAERSILTVLAQYGACRGTRHVRDTQSTAVASIMQLVPAVAKDGLREMETWRSLTKEYGRSVLTPHYPPATRF